MNWDFDERWLEQQRANGRTVADVARPTAPEGVDARRSSSTRQVPRQREHELQVSLVELCRYKRRQYPALRYLLAYPAGGHRHPAVAAKMKAEGVRAGVSDLLLAAPSKNPNGDVYHGLWLELKVPGGRVRESQQEWLDAMRRQGYAARVAWSFDEAWQTIENYLNEELEG